MIRSHRDRPGVPAARNFGRDQIADHVTHNYYFRAQGNGSREPLTANERAQYNPCIQRFNERPDADHETHCYYVGA